jgi:hypothetical protein
MLIAFFDQGYGSRSLDFISALNQRLDERAFDLSLVVAPLIIRRRIASSPI